MDSTNEKFYYFIVKDKSIVSVDLLSDKDIKVGEEYIKLMSQDIINIFYTNTLTLKDNISMPAILNTVEEVQQYFTIVETSKKIDYKNPDKIMMKEIMANKIGMIQKDKTIEMLGKELMQNKVSNVQKDSQIQMLSKQVMDNKLTDMKKDEQIELLMKTTMENKIQLNKLENK